MILAIVALKSKIFFILRNPESNGTRRTNSVCNQSIFLQTRTPIVETFLEHYNSVCSLTLFVNVFTTLSKDYKTVGTLVQRYRNVTETFANLFENELILFFFGVYFICGWF